MLKSKKKPGSLLSPDNPSLLPALCVAAIASMGAAMFLQVVSIGISASSANKELPPYVLDENGNRYAVKLGTAVSSASQVKAWASNKMVELFNWQAVLPPAPDDPTNKPIPDRGVPVPVGTTTKLITTSAWQALLAVEAPFQQSFASTIAKLTPPEVFTGSAQVVFQPVAIGVPETQGDRKWKVRIVGGLAVFKGGNNIPEIIPLDYDVFVREVDYLAPVKEKEIKKIEAELQKKEKQLPKEILKDFTLSDLAKAVYKSRNGYTIIGMNENLKR